jgi:hypothetical protein
MSRVERDERGAALLLAIAFLIVVGLIGGGVISLISSASVDRAALDNARNREYSADAAIETAIGQVRTNMTTNNKALTPCDGLPVSVALNGVTVSVTCTYAPTITTTRFYLRNVIFTAQCASPYTARCPNGSEIIRAQVNYASSSLLTDPSIVVNRTYVQSWSVNG